MKIYILKCYDGSYYTGITENLECRVEAHCQGKGSEYTKQRRPVRLVYFEEKDSKEEAKKREVEIKRLKGFPRRRLEWSAPRDCALK